MAWILSLVVLFLAVVPGWAEEFHLLGGAVENIKTHDGSYSWQLEYREGLGEHFAFGYTYLNEGKLLNHHRDGHSLQFWTRANMLERRLSLAAGAGPYFYLDTTPDSGGNRSLNDHGWGALVSLSATWFTESPWLFQLRSNWVATGSSIDSVSALFGIGYQLEKPSTPGPLPTASTQGKKTTNNDSDFSRA